MVWPSSTNRELPLSSDPLNFRISEVNILFKNYGTI
jgi:hypothetical protein